MTGTLVGEPDKSPFPDFQFKILEVVSFSQLYKLGYHNIDALDPSAGLLQHAGSLNIYTNIIVDCVYPDKKNSVKDCKYCRRTMFEEWIHCVQYTNSLFKP